MNRTLILATFGFLGVAAASGAACSKSSDGGTGGAGATTTSTTSTTSHTTSSGTTSNTGGGGVGGNPGGGSAPIGGSGGAAVSVCNPITNAGCTQAGESCDIDGSTGVFVCFPPPNDVALCDVCSNSSTGPFCAPGMHCNEDTNSGQCSKFCCDSGDCGTGTCDKSQMPNGVGVCVGSGAGGAGGGAALASCDAPATQPSGGSCYAP